LYIDDDKKYIELLKSIKSKGFSTITDQIVLIKKNNEQKYIVAEGNRRISILKILLNYQNFLDFLKTKSSDFKKFIEKIKSELNKPNKNNKKIFDFLKRKDFIIIEENDEISNAIYKNHINGEKIGYSPWKRGKYYLTILKIFKNENIYKKEDLYKKDLNILVRFNKDEDKIWKDYLNACFIFQIINDNIQDEEKTSKIMAKEKISAYEKTFVRDILKKIIKNITGQEKFDLKKIFDPVFNEESRKYIKNSENIDEFVSFSRLFYKLKSAKLLTTRNLFDEMQMKEIEKIFNECNISIPVDTSNIDNSEINNFSIPKLQYLLKESKDENIKDFSRTKINLVYSSNNTSKKLKQIVGEKNNVFSILIKQLDYNSSTTENYYHNAIVSTLRALVFYISKTVIFNYVININLKTDINQNNDIVELYNEVFANKKVSNEEILGYHLNELKNEILKQFVGIDKSINIKNFLDSFIKINNGDNSENKIKIIKLLNNALNCVLKRKDDKNLKLFDNISSWWGKSKTYINLLMHSPQFYDYDFLVSMTKINKKITKFLEEFIELILQHIDSEKMQKIIDDNLEFLKENEDKIINYRNDKISIKK
ncbi:hypothetical protein PT308_02955, partial [Metamycoplasma hyosynoviae]